MRIEPTSQAFDSPVEPLQALARALGRMAAREHAAPVSRPARSSNRSNFCFNAEGSPSDEFFEVK